MTRRPFAALAITTVLVAAAAVGASASAAPTQSAWTDQTLVSASVSAGTWTTAPPPGSGCVAMRDDGTPLPGGTCDVVDVRFNQWTDGLNTVRDYYIHVRFSPGASHAQLAVDLSDATGNEAGAWAWDEAVTLPTGQFTPPADFLCSELPVLRANGPSGWGSDQTLYVKVLERASSTMGADRTCR